MQTDDLRDDIELVRVERTATIDADVDEVWDSLTSAEGMTDWLGTAPDFAPADGAATTVTDDDGTVRHLLVTHVDDGERRLTWHWWDEDDVLSSVEIVATPSDAGTQVRVTEIRACAAAPAMSSVDAFGTGFAATASGWSGRSVLGWEARLRRLSAAGRLVAVA